MIKEEIPIKFHVEGNKIIFDDYWTILSGDEIAVEHTIDEQGIIHYTHIYLIRRVSD